MVVYNIVLLVISCASLHAANAQPQLYYNGHDSLEDYSLEDYSLEDYSLEDYSLEDYSPADKIFDKLHSYYDSVVEDTEELYCRYATGSDFRDLLRFTLSSHNSIRNQKEFNHCWAFSVMASIERQIEITYGKKVTLSEQYIVDCCWECQELCYHCWESKGGYIGKAFTFLMDRGLVSRDSYAPYDGKIWECQASAPRLPYRIAYINYILVRDEAALIAELRKGSYISLSILVTEDFGRFFDANPTGIFPQTLCGLEGKTNHAVALVGYGYLEETGELYWELRNSWGTSHAHCGYFRMLRTGVNYCGNLYGQVAIF